ncbi:MAG: putative Na+/H+ antiporter [SAR324 cluster bacterium]|nr:putative Na+/H+ antiporter [SAR324 cluster bacterium]MBL7034408.1 putative Na+/H+ antiporter [SAR324 cluster bacterium]
MNQIRKYWLGLIMIGGLAAIAVASGNATTVVSFPTPLEAYADADLIKSGDIFSVLANRIAHTPFNLWASLTFLCAIIHTFFAGKITGIAHQFEHSFAEQMKAEGKSEEEIERNPPIAAEMLHFLGEVEAIFGIWILVLAAITISYYDWFTFKNYISHTVNYTEPMFVVVIMALASTRPVMQLARQIMGVFAGMGKHSPGAWWLSILTLAPVLGSFITEPAAMTIGAMLLAQQFYQLKPSTKLAYATIGLLFVNVSVGGTVTHFAAPPVLMVAAKWDWTLSFMAVNFGWKAILGIIISNILYFLVFKREFSRLAHATSVGKEELDWEHREDPVPVWITTLHLLFMAWTVVTAHDPPLFIGGFLFFLGFAIATQQHQNRVNLKPAMMVGFFLAGLVTHGGMQAWWIAPVLGSLPDLPLMLTATILTAFNDNAAITFLSTLVPGFAITAKYAVVAGAVTGGGLTVIANAPNPAGQSILSKFFPGGVNPAKLAMGAIIPTIIMGLAFMAIPQDVQDPQQVGQNTEEVSHQ